MYIISWHVSRVAWLLRLAVHTCLFMCHSELGTCSSWTQGSIHLLTKGSCEAASSDKAVDAG